MLPEVVPNPGSIQLGRRLLTACVQTATFLEPQGLWRATPSNGEHLRIGPETAVIVQQIIHHTRQDCILREDHRSVRFELVKATTAIDGAVLHFRHPSECAPDKAFLHNRKIRADITDLMVEVARASAAPATKPPPAARRNVPSIATAPKRRSVVRSPARY